MWLRRSLVCLHKFYSLEQNMNFYRWYSSRKHFTSQSPFKHQKSPLSNLIKYFWRVFFLFWCSIYESISFVFFFLLSHVIDLYYNLQLYFLQFSLPNAELVLRVWRYKTIFCQEISRADEDPRPTIWNQQNSSDSLGEMIVQFLPLTNNDYKQLRMSSSQFSHSSVGFNSSTWLNPVSDGVHTASTTDIALHHWGL